MTDQCLARRIRVRGIVQGVGFRPFVYRLAHEYGVQGWVLNDEHGLSIHAEGTPNAVESLLSELRAHPPAGARIDRLETTAAIPEGGRTFEIRSSARSAPPSVLISPDLAVCAACLQELHDSENRRYLYPYINCTECGPRYSIVRSLPYDRPHTTLADWPLCTACQIEYNNPHDRRYHAQPTACPKCGPDYQLSIGPDVTVHGTEALRRAAVLLNDGRIVAIKGLGGYHLACAARDSAAVKRLRERKFRKEKPFAIMARDLETACELAQANDLHRTLLTSSPHPIVLVPSRTELAGVAPDSHELGILLPYTPLHELLFQFGAPNPLVMTSGNKSSEPIAYLDADARERLDGIADAFLVGERPIARRVDDSVVAVREGRMTMLRRARGFAPAAVAHWPVHRPILAVGADLKNSLVLVVSGAVICSQHIGDLGDQATDTAFTQTIHDLLAMYQIDPRELVVAHDAHPEFVSTRWARQLVCYRHVPVQHHRAHIASVVAESEDLERPVIGLALDGTGYGDDGAIWGCEVFCGSISTGFRRLAHLHPATLPGGDAASRWPVQAAAGFLHGLILPDLRQPPFGFPDRFFLAQELVRKNVRCFPTTSAGRLFDTVAALCGFLSETSYEGQAAVWLEQQARTSQRVRPYSLPDLDYRPLLSQIIADRRVGRAVPEIACAFHAGLAQSLAQTATAYARQYAVDGVALSGGVFQNELLRSLITDYNSDTGNLHLLFNRTVPANDGGIALGQAAIAASLCLRNGVPDPVAEK